MSDDSQRMPEFPAVSLAALDALELPFLYADASGTPGFLSSRGARLLAIRDRGNLERYRSLLQSLLECGMRASSREGERRGMSSPSAVAELQLITADNRFFNAFAFARPIITVGEERTPGSLTVFHDLTPLESFFHTIEQSRRNRAVLILGSSLFGRSLLFQPGGTDIHSLYRSVEDSFFRNQPSLDENVMQTDLLRGLSIAVDIVDPLLLPSAKIISEVKISALLRISQPNFLRIVAHLLVEAADFAGPAGVSKVSSRFVAVSEAQGAPAQMVELSINAQRRSSMPLDASPLELYLYRRYMPLNYRITLNERPTPTERESDGRIEKAAALPEEALSENAAIGLRIARQCNVPSEILLLEQDQLQLRAQFPLYSEKL